MQNCIAAITAAYLPPALLQTPFPNWVVVSGGSPPWYLDALKTGIGSLFGAGVAFFFAVLHRRMQERNANLQAGNLALFKLRTIQRRTGELRIVVRHDIAEKRKAFSDTPTWSLVKPMLLTMDDVEVFDFDSLAFLLDSESGKEAVKHVKHAEELFSTLKLVFTYHQDAAIDYQKSTVDLRRTIPNASWEQIKEHVGAELIGRRDSLFLALLQHVEQNPAINKTCFTKLEAAMQERFHARVWKLDFDFDPKSARAEPNLPALPDDLKKVVDEFPK
ncbi:hypothetical protein R69619_03336 [Paraburkholderia nemoris]|uniref:hypothetical protein n=1 Tax=Paraburkholderia nemoris TaxID=2793076 RepID=UPI001B1F6C02|nr:hypothetical protein [Paraburkholderia nemoris]CAE6760159.1 hypothetical protein R69619_03336 [Paraburkholderia nemoris]